MPDRRYLPPRCRIAISYQLLDDDPEVVTSDWIYLRFHGGRQEGNYSPQTLSAWARKIRDYRAQGLDVFAFFNNDLEGYAVENARDLRRYLEQNSVF